MVSVLFWFPCLLLLSSLSWRKEDEGSSNSVLVRSYPRKYRGIQFKHMYYLTEAVSFNLHNRFVELSLYSAQAKLTIHHREWISDRFIQVPILSFSSFWLHCFSIFICIILGCSKFKFYKIHRYESLSTKKNSNMKNLGNNGGAL